MTADTLFNTTVTDGTGPATAVTTSGKNVGDLLNEAGIPVGPLDIVNVPAETPLSNGLSITITRVAQSHRDRRRRGRAARRPAGQ